MQNHRASSVNSNLKRVSIIEKELKALEILTEKLGITLYETFASSTELKTQYIIDIGGCVGYQLRKEEYDLLREALK